MGQITVGSTVRIVDDDGEPCDGTVRDAGAKITVDFGEWFEVWPPDGIVWRDDLGLWVAPEHGEITDIV